MEDKDKSREQLIEELKALRKRIAELEESETARNQADEEICGSMEMYMDMFENSPDLIQSIAPDGRIVCVNRAWRETLGYSKEEISHLTLFDIIHPESREHCMKQFQCLMAGEQPDKIVVTFAAKDGRKIILEGRANCKFVDGKPVSTRGIFRNITERKLAEKELIETGARLQDLLCKLHSLLS